MVIYSRIADDGGDDDLTFVLKRSIELAKEMKMGKSNKPEESRYFIVERDSLSAHGNEIGSDKAEAERLLAESVGDLVVIRGVIIKPYFNLE